MPLQLYGRASGNVILEGPIPNPNLNILYDLTQQGIHLASSCNGKGVCKKCVVWFKDKQMLACQNTWSTLMERQENRPDDCLAILEVDYL